MLDPKIETDMKKILIASLAALAVFSAACSKSDVAESGKMQVRVSASAEDLASKVTSSTSGRFTWQKGDAIGVWTGAGITKFTLDPEWDGFGYGEFVGELPEGGAIDADSYAVYPYSEGAEATATAYTWPSVPQMTIPTSNYMLYARGEVTEKDGKVADFHFKHSTAYFRVTVKNIRADINGLYIESAGPCFAMGNKVEFSDGGVVLTPALGENIVYALPEHSGVVESITLVIPVAAGTYEQAYGKGGLKFRIAGYSAPNWWSTKYDDFAGYFGEGTGFTVAAGDYYVFPDLRFANAKSADDSGSGVNDGIEDAVVVVQDPDGFWK